MVEENKTDNSQSPRAGAGPGSGPGGPGGGQGQGQQRRRRPKSRFGEQMLEKKNLKELFRINERQLRNLYEEAKRSGEETGPYLISLLERRLDNAVYRTGISQTRPAARQLATHRFFAVNGKPTDVPSYRLRKGDVVTVLDSKRKGVTFSNFVKRMQNINTPSWLTMDAENFTFRVESSPDAEEANLGVDIKSIVELLAR